MPKLECLEVYCDRSMRCHSSEPLSRLTQLKHLSVSYQLNNSDVEAVVRGCRELRTLELLDCQVADGGRRVSPDARAAGARGARCGRAARCNWTSPTLTSPTRLIWNAGDARKVYASQSKVGTLSGCSSSISLCDMIEPPDYEEVADRLMGPRDPLAYPPHDMELCTVPRRIRTITHVLPDEDLSKAPMFVRDCIRTYTSDYTVVEHKHRQHSGSTLGRERLGARLERLATAPRQLYEVDEDQVPESQPSSGRQSVASISSSSSCNETLTPRGSWASLDLRSSSADPLLPDLFERRPPDQQDAVNEARRLENRQADLLGLYSPYLDEEEAVERRLAAEMPSEVTGHRILVHCHQLKLELDVEPLFASMALYDAKEKKKLSENFYFNLNSECTRQMLSGHVPHADLSTMSRSAVFDIMNPSADVFLVVRVEKVLQGDVNECVEPYIKDDKNREKVRAGAQAACSRLGKYRMPLAWSAVSLLNILSGSDRDERDTGTNTNSLDRKASSSSLEQLRRRAGEVGGSLTRKGSVERRAPPADELAPQLDTMKPVSITVTSFFKQETDKLRDEDLYKFLVEIKRPSSAPKKLKCITGVLKIEVAPCPEELKNGLTPELAKLHPYGDENVRPTKEVLPFPIHPVAAPHLQYRNLMYVNVREINLNAYTSRAGSARNITVRVQLMSGEQQSSALPAIFGRSSCPEYTSEAYTTVLYHNKNPSLYDEIKIKLPADLGDQHHLLFTFLHISCQRKPVAPEQEKNVETVVGYSWLPLCRNGKLTCGEFNLPVMQEEPPPNYSYIFPDVLLPGTRWIDNHKPIFSVTLDAHTTVHPLDNYIERFAVACEAVQEGNIPTRIGLANMEAELRASISELPTANVEILSRYLPYVLDKLLHLLVAPPSLAGAPLNIAQDVFTCLANVFTDVCNMNEGVTCDPHGRSSLITAYIQYQCTIPRPSLADRDIGLPLPPAVMSDGSCKILHEELALQWVVASGATRDLAMHNSWALFELMIKSMCEYLYWSGAHEAPRKARFPDQFTDDITTLVNNVTTEIISRYGKNSRLTQSLNNSLAFFLFDLLSIADRGYVFNLIRSYHKQMSAKIASCRTLCLLCSTSTHEHRSRHYLAGLLLHDLTAALDLQSVYTSTILVLELGYILTHEHRSRHYLAGLLLHDLTAALDLQSYTVLQCAAVNALLSLLTAHDADPRLSAPEVRARVAQLYMPLLGIVLDAAPMLSRSSGARDVIQFDGEMGQFNNLYNPSVNDPDNKQTGRPPFNSETHRNLLMCLVWLLKSCSRSALAQCCAELPPARLPSLLHLLHLCFIAHEYKGRKELLKCQQQNVRKTTDIKAKLEDVILGQGSARSDFIMRRKGGSSAVPGRRERWRKDWRGARDAPPSPLAPHPALPAALAAEVSLTTIVQSCSNMESGQAVCSAALQVVLRAMQRNQSATVLQHMFATVRSLIVKLGWSCCGEESGICRVLLRHCAALCPTTRAHAAAALYALMRHHYQLGNNFSRVKMQVTMSLSSLVGTSTTFSEESLRRALKTILVHAERDPENPDLQQTSFPEQVKDLVFNLHMILSDTVKMKEFQEDPEMLLDLMHRIARGYQHSPDLRLTWLNNMAQKHMELTHHELQALLEHAASELMTAGMYEAVNEVYKVLIPIAEEHRDYKKLANIHGKLNEAFTRIDQLHGKRVFGTYFRVSFYGALFGDLHGEEFIYKEHALTKLPEIFSRLENFYGQRFGAENVVIIKDSNIVDPTTLPADKAHIQITYVEPYFEPHELRTRTTHSERNYNIKRFMYATPFTVGGRAHGDIAEQCKRKTILTTAHHFPYVKTRIQVVSRTQIILTPIEVAIEDIQKKINELAAATSQEPADPKILQMVVQGCIGTTVNQGPLELAQVFLAPVADGSQPPTRLTNKLRLAFKDFSKKCHDALKKNKNLIGSDQREYQRELERNYARFAERLAPLVMPAHAHAHAAQLSNGVSKPDYKLQA
ncbi:LOW QUALITY PROTEIN: dedicator of cytokinesis protein 7 [Leguminivora glycinivorella]|uniref:LOW QUALITY PROTEIN: dedicator of cytokinesis protein 7 n=1 Tax=Leguminivora glycinivorella TaxID=1035111 RepID=UPI00200E9C3B|nr:LOW QUALITY PROTEIN: dedicator of cytokinesis protein 7 [Leguminivora glycinivorella]